MKIRMTILMTMLMASAVQVYAQQDREAFKAALDACSTETGVSRPEPGVQPSEEDRAKLTACLQDKGFTPPSGEGSRGQRPLMDETTKAAFDECAAANGITLGQGTRPSEEERAKMDSCLETKGITPPQGGGRGPGRGSAQ